jgi:hypothetical protein
MWNSIQKFSCRLRAMRNSAESIFVVESKRISLRIRSIFKTAIAHESVDPGELFDEKTRGLKSRETVPLSWLYINLGAWWLKICSRICPCAHAQQCCHTFSGAHRYLMSRLSLQVFYLWRHVLSTPPLFILWWSNLEILFAPLHRSSPFTGGLRCQAIQTEHGPYTV